LIGILETFVSLWAQFIYYAGFYCMPNFVNTMHFEVTEYWIF